MRRDTDARFRDKNRSNGILTTALAVLFAVVLSGCPKVPVHKRPHPRPLPPMEVKEPARAPAQPMTPERTASDMLVGRGVALLDQGNYERASSVFRDAANVDSSNGAAYYYLAVAGARLGEPDEALGLLEKAESLLGQDHTWMERIESLRRELGGEAPMELYPSPVYDAF